MPEDKVSPSLFNGNQIPHNDQETEQESPVSPVSTELKPSRKLALLEFRCRMEDAILGNYILGKRKGKFSTETEENLREISLWGVPLLPSKGDESTDTILIKFLKAKDYKVSEAFKMLQNTLQWRRETKVEGILEENFGSDFENAGLIDGTDKLGHPLCYSVYEVFKGGEICKKNNGGEENWEEFRRWNIQFTEKGIQKLDFKPGGVDSIVQIIDLKNAPEPLIKDICLAGKKSVLMFQENYPGIIFKSIIINSPLWFSAFHAIDFRYITHKTKSNLIFVRPSRVTETLIKYIAPEIIPIQYGGLNRENNGEFSPQDEVLQHKLKGGAIEQIEIYVDKAGVTVVWDMTVAGFEVNYKEVFVPEDDCSYKILIQKEKKMEETIRNSFHITEPGKIVMTIENSTYKKKKVFYRYKFKPTVPMYYISSY